ncbi:MAG: homoserine kinase [Gammaproteobacteria bacterium]|jgi:homoserine kinase|nr:homoserine kinase [Gammaproteobacteria bacterium]
MNSTAFAPASIGNFSVGFDVLGLALSAVDGSVLGDRVEVSASEQMQLVVSGDYAHAVPHDASNLVFQAGVLLQQWLLEHGVGKHCWQLQLQKGLPVASGTGSSAASAVAAVRALADWCQEHLQLALPADEQWRMLAALEAQASGSAHLDNLAPAMLGGLVLCPLHGLPRRLPVINHWHYVLAYSGQHIATRAARASMPESYPRAVTIRQMQRLAMVVDGLHRQDADCVLAHLQDEIAEPYRAGLIDGYVENRECLLAAGARFVGISGSGPSLFAIADDAETAQRLADELQQQMPLLVGGFISVCRVYERD